MRALVIGRGSMGRRRIRDLGALGVVVTSWDMTDAEFDGRADGAPAELVVVSTPPLAHKWYAGVFGGRPLFTEADVEAFDAPHYPSATPLFTSWYAKMREDYHTESALSYTLHVGQHIDDWHPGADPKTYYAYQPETRPTREMIPFELIWLAKFYGPLVGAQGFLGFDVAHVVVHHADIVGHIFVDALSRPAVRDFTVVGEGYRRTWNLSYTEADYLAEMRALLGAIEGRTPWPYSQSEEAANLGVLHMIERSA